EQSASQSNVLTPASRTVVIASIDNKDFGAWIQTAQVMSTQRLGSPLLNRDGQVIGIYTRRVAALNKDQALWIGSRQINEFVRSHFNIAIPNSDQTAGHS
ncbi:MAG: hypothetical protein JOZ44_12160, partial [Acidobacteria bacterium]|nr:hypothetical protein [Acidobacteriota bacterium]